jgi:tetratricopeptide (TPR) repeat protein
MGSLALTYASLGEFNKAVRLQEETLARQRETLGADHPDTLTSLVNLATTYQELDRHADALKLNQETLTVMSKAFGADDPNTLVVKHNLAGNYSALGRHDEALKLHEETAAAFLAAVGPDHPYTLLSMGSPALSYLEMGRVDDAIALQEKTLAAMTEKFGPQDPETLKALHNLALSHAAAGQHEKALQLFEQALDLRRKNIGADHPDTLASVAGVARCLEKLDRAPDALSVLDATFVAVAGREADASRAVEVLMLRVIASHLRGDAPGAKAAVDRLASLLSTDYRSLYALACSTARLAATLTAADPSPSGQQQAQEASNRAVNLLRQAIAAGYRNAPGVAQDPAFDALREQEGFRMALAELSKR